MSVPTWSGALSRYRLRRDLVTRARQAPFAVQATGSALIVTPGSGLERRITQAQFERSVPLIGLAGRAALLEASYNSSYIEAIVDDLRQG
ncbi:MAG: hypothetical protein ACYDAN_07310 [Candidatus Limnocylindrales bacterium]